MTKTTNNKKHKSPASSSFPISISALIALSLFVAAFLVRLVYLFQIRSTLTFTNPLMDSLFYINRSRAIASGTFHATQAFFMGPFYPYFLALIIKLSGFGWLKIRLIQIAVGALSVVLVYEIAVSCFRHRKIAVTAAVLSVFWGGFIYYDANLLMAFLVVFLNLSLLWSLLGLLKKPTAGRFLTSGIILGLSTLARGNILLFIPFCLLWFYRAFRLRFSLSALGKRIAVFLLGTGLLILPVTVRNYLVEGDWVLLTSNGGLNFYIGNNPHSKGIYIPLNQLKLPYGPTPSTPNDRMDIQARKIAEKVEGRKLKSTEVSNFWYRQAREFFHREPGGFLLNMITKAALSWNGKEIPQIENFYFFQQRFSILNIPLLNFGIVAPLALWGIILGLRNPAQEIRLLIYYLLAMTLAISLFFVTSRYRIPLVPVVLILAAFAFHDITDRLRRRKWFSAARGMIGVGIFAVLVNQPMVKNDFAADHYNLGSIYYQLGDWEKAREEFSNCLSIRPDYTDAYRAKGIIERRSGNYNQAMNEFIKALILRPGYLDIRANIALLYLEQNRLDEARYELEEIMRKDGDFYPGLMIKGRLLLLDRRYREAENVILQAAKRMPEKPEAHFLLGRIHADRFHFDLAINEFQTAIRLTPPQAVSALLYYNLGISRHRAGKLELAEKALRRAAEKDSALTEVHTALGNLFFDTNRFDEAVKRFEIAYRQRPDVSNQYNLANAYAEANLEEQAIEVYEKLLSANPRHPRALNNLGNVYLNKKQYDKAIIYYEKAIRLNPEFTIALHNLGDIYRDLKQTSRALDYYRQSLFLEKSSKMIIMLREKINSLP